MSWMDAINLNRSLVRGAGQTDLAIVVSGSSTDSAFWESAVEKVKQDTLREDGQLRVVSLTEGQPLGNFLGTISAWSEVNRLVSPSRGVSLMSMVFGKGKRFSPFTQALGNRKAAFPTPLRGTRSGVHLRTGDLATLYSNSWLEQLSARGFNGVLVKWGDEAIIPSLSWASLGNDFSDIDLIRFVWKTRPTDVLAREKEWFIVNEESRLIERLIPRQNLSSILASVAKYEGDRYSTAVNLGSIAASYSFLSIAADVFGKVLDRPGAMADWDPFTTLLLLSALPSQSPTGVDDSPALAAGLAQAEERCPGLHTMIQELRSRLHKKMGRPLRVGFLDFGEAFWVDFGLHTTLRQTLEALTQETPRGDATRAIFGLPNDRDANGNIVVSSTIPNRARIENSVIVGSTILDAETVVSGGVVVGSRHNGLSMPHGGASLFSAVQHLDFEGPHGIAFRSLGSTVKVPPGGRHTSLVLGDTTVSLLSDESIRYDESEYSAPILGNELSFEEAGRRAGAIDPWQLEAGWQKASLDLEV